MGERDKRHFGDVLEIVFDTVLDDVVHVYDQLFQFVEALVHVGQIGVDVHGGPSQGRHPWMQFQLHVCNMWGQQVFANWFDLAIDALVFLQHIEELVIVHFELLLLEQDDAGTLGNRDALPVEALGLPDQLHDVHVEVHVQLLLGLMTDDEGRLKSSFGPLDLLDPEVIVPHLIDGEHLAKSIVISIVLLYLGRMDNVLGELCYGTRYLLIEMLRPDDLAGVVRHVADDGRVSLLVVEDALDDFELTGIVGEDCVVLGGQVVLEGVPLNRVLKLLEKVD